MKEPIRHTELFPGEIPEDVFGAGIIPVNIPPLRGVTLETGVEVFELGSKLKLGIDCLPKKIDARVIDLSSGEVIEIYGKSKILGEAALKFELLEYEDQDEGVSTQVDFSLLVMPSRYSKGAESMMDKRLKKTIPIFGPRYKQSILKSIRTAGKNRKRELVAA